jgi:hypothetical protein
VGLRESRETDGTLAWLRFTYRGRDVDVWLDAARQEWRVYAGGRAVGRVDAAGHEDAQTVARRVIRACFAP